MDESISPYPPSGGSLATGRPPPALFPARADEAAELVGDPVIDGAERLLDEVHDALSRMERGTFGSCEVCGEPIDAARLIEQPTVRTCGRHLEGNEAGPGGA